MELTSIEKQLIKILKLRNVDKHTVAGIVFTRKTDENCSKMIHWLENNKRAGQIEIMEYLYPQFANSVRFVG